MHIDAPINVSIFIATAQCPTLCLQFDEAPPVGLRILLKDIGGSYRKTEGGQSAWQFRSSHFDWLYVTAMLVQHGWPRLANRIRSEIVAHIEQVAA